MKKLPPFEKGGSLIARTVIEVPRVKRLYQCTRLIGFGSNDVPLVVLPVDAVIVLVDAGTVVVVLEVLRVEMLAVRKVVDVAAAWVAGAGHAMSLNDVLARRARSANLLVSPFGSVAEKTPTLVTSS